MLEQIIVKDWLISYLHFQIEMTGARSVLFLHGWRSNKEILQPVIAQLQNQFNIYGLDLPGFGGSQTPQKSLSVGDYANVVGEFIRKLELKRVILVGHSFGGRVAIKLAANHPATVEKLILVDS